MKHVLSPLGRLRLVGATPFLTPLVLFVAWLAVPCSHGLAAHDLPEFSQRQKGQFALAAYRRGRSRRPKLLGRRKASGIMHQTPAKCAECHRQITAQWAASAHAIAWTNPQFVAESDDYQQEQCLSCHAPTPLLQQPPSALPQLRKHRLPLGVDCHTCHFVACAYAGPYESRLGPHPVKKMATRLIDGRWPVPASSLSHEQGSRVE